eukprot:1662365-Amphidinium_carterae.1
MLSQFLTSASPSSKVLNEICVSILWEGTPDGGVGAGSTRECKGTELNGSRVQTRGVNVLADAMLYATTPHMFAAGSTG